MELSIIIVNRNTRDLLAQCLDSIYAHLPNCDFEIWVVDNASSDGSAQMVRERFPAVRLIENRENVGFARANNQAIRTSAGAHLLFLNSDTVVQSDALSRLLAFMLMHPQAGFVSAYLLKRDGSAHQSSLHFPSFWSETACAFGLDSRFPFSNWLERPLDSAANWVRCDCVPGAAFMIRRSVLDAVGLFDEQFFMYSEEVDLQLRTKKKGWANYVVCSARITHLGGASTRKLVTAMKTELFRSKLYYFRKHHSRVSAIVLRWIFKASILGRIVRYHFLRDQRKKELWTETWKYLGRDSANPLSDHRDQDGLTVPAQPIS